MIMLDAGRKNKRLKILTGFVLATIYVIAVIFTFHPSVPELKIVLPAYVNSDVTLVQRKEIIPQREGVPSAHSSSLAKLPDGRMAVVWYGGSYEGAKDTCIYFSVRDARGWTMPVAVTSRFSTAAETGIHAYRIGNPVLAVDESGRIHIYYVSTDWFGWAAGKINHKVSIDGGNSWGKAERLQVNPFLNISSLTRISPVFVRAGKMILPIYFECGMKHPQLAWCKEGVVQKVWNYPQMDGAIQPALVAAPSGNIFMYCRDSNDRYKRVRLGEIDSKGNLLRNTATNIPNSDASVAAVNYGRLILLVGNPVTDGSRGILSLFASENGIDFVKIVDIEKGNSEFSYPSIVVNGDKICISYTYRRTNIAYVEYSGKYINAEVVGKIGKDLR